MTDVTLEVAGMQCDGCASSVGEALESVAGVSRVDASLDGGEARVAADDATSQDALVNAVEEAGYTAVIAR